MVRPAAAVSLAVPETAMSEAAGPGAAATGPGTGTTGVPTATVSAASTGVSWTALGSPAVLTTAKGWSPRYSAGAS